MNNQEITKFRYKFFDRTSINSNTDKNDWIFNKIMKFEISECDDNFAHEHFGKYLFDKVVFEKEWNLLKEKLNNSQIVYLHSYGKNGKSTFLHHFLRDRKSEKSNYEIINFSSLNKYWSANLNERTRDFLKSIYYLELQKDKDHRIIDFLNYLFTNLSFHKQIIGTNNSRIVEFVHLLSKKIKKKLHAKEYIDEDRQLDCHYLISDLFNDNELTNEYLLCALLSFKCYQHARKGSTRELIIALDDLDDVFTYLPERINQVLTIVVYEFIHDLQNIYTSIFKCKDGYRLDLKFIFVYRTSNYLSSIYTDISKNEQSRLQFYKNNASKLRLSSVQEPFGIYQKRIDFYITLCGINKIIPSNKARLLLTFLHVIREYDFDYRNIYLQRVFRLWNGNKFRLTEFIMNTDFTESELLLLLDIDRKINSNIKINIFHNKLVKYFIRVESGNTLSKFIEYSINNFERDKVKGQCSISRLFFTYIFNERQKNLKIETIPDSYFKGISLKSFIEEIKSIRRNNSPVYTDNDISELFLNLFSFEIDNWGNFFSCVTATDIRSLNKPTEYYKFVHDIQKVLSEGSQLEKVKFFYNDSAPYFMFQFKRSFEYFSVCENTNNPILSNLKITILGDKRFNTNFERTLDAVLERVRISTRITIEFYENHFGNFTLSDYVNSSFSYKSKFYFDDLISKIIAYLEDIRYAVLQSIIPITGGYEELPTQAKQLCKNYINKCFTLNIEKYVKHFFELTTRLELANKEKYSIDASLSLNTEKDYALPESLSRSITSFKILQNQIDKIKESNFVNTDLEIKTRYRYES